MIIPRESIGGWKKGLRAGFELVSGIHTYIHIYFVEQFCPVDPAVGINKRTRMTGKRSLSARLV